ncbi:MAG: hypothetical protein A2107_12905 [Verrucomicrobia bacterium GWF2_62_7]|nr:MAG: hypothetical protein A2107_12905 [Verrucomicrobia bacterium GWF2_62_7]
MVEVLLAHKADINAKDQMGFTPLHWAVVSLKKEIVSLLLANKPEINAKNSEGYTPLHLLARIDFKVVPELQVPCKDVINLLLVNKADVNSKANDGSTALDAATKSNNTDIAALLRKHGGKSGKELGDADAAKTK